MMIIHSIALLLSLAVAAQDRQDPKPVQTGRAWQSGARRTDEAAPASQPATVAAKAAESRPAEAVAARRKNAAPPVVQPKPHSGRSLAFGARRPPAESEPVSGDAREASTPRAETRPAPERKQSGRSFK